PFRSTVRPSRHQFPPHYFSQSPPTPPFFALPLPDALPICDFLLSRQRMARSHDQREFVIEDTLPHHIIDRRRIAERADQEVNLANRKSTRLNSSHVKISYAVFCLKKKKECRRCRTRCTSLA